MCFGISGRFKGTIEDRNRTYSAELSDPDSDEYAAMEESVCNTVSHCNTTLRPIRYMLASWHGPFTRYVQLRVAHAPGIPGTFSPPPRISDPDMHHGTCATHVPWSLTRGFLWSRWRGKRSRHSRDMRNPQFYVSGKRSIGMLSALLWPCLLCEGIP